MTESEHRATFCEWYRQDGNEYAWNTGCGRVYEFHDSTNREDFVYCPYCGKIVHVDE